jgi:hypothetical protein
VPLRRLFLLGAATLASIAAFVAIVAVLNGEFGETEGKLFATLAATFVAGSTSIAGLSCLARGASRPVGVLGIALACGGYVLWTEQIWAQHDSETYWKVLLVLLAWTLATLVAMTTRLMVHTPRLVRRLYPATAAAAGGAAFVASVMILRENGDGWQLFAVLLILTVLGETLAPILDRYAASDDRPVVRQLGIVAGAEVVAVRGRDGPSVRVGSETLRLADDETVVVRPAQ